MGTATTEVSPSDQQWQAIRSAGAWVRDVARKPVFYLAGYAGSGKTTIIPEIVDIVNLDPFQDVVFCAPTGKAARVMRRKLLARGLNISVQTIHKTIYKPPIDLRKDEEDEDIFIRRRLAGRSDLTFDLDPKSPVKNAKLIVVDEASMVGKALAADLMSFGVPVLAIGDPGQLPPVDDDSGLTVGVPDFFITEIHRQARDNPIIRLSADVRAGGYPAYGIMGDQVRIVRPGSIDIPDNAAAMPMVIVGTHKKRWLMTAAMREAMGFGSDLPMAGERIICCKNSRDLPSLVNGSEGAVTRDAERAKDDAFAVVMHAIDDEGGPMVRPVEDEVTGDFSLAPVRAYRGLFDEHQFRRRGAVDGNERFAYFKSKELEHFDFGWAITCHKAQGSQWPDVLVWDESFCFRDQWKRWLYTAITRAEDRLTLVTG